MDLDPQEGESKKRDAPRELEIEDQVILLAQERMVQRGPVRKLVHPWILLGICVFVTGYIYVLLLVTWKDQVVALAGTVFVISFIMGFAIFANHKHESTQGSSCLDPLFVSRESRMSFDSGLVAPLPGGD